MNKKKLSRIIKLLLILGSLTFLYYKLSASDILDFWNQSLNFLSDDSKRLYFSWAVLLVALNWGIEALKWKKLIRKLELISFGGALKAVLAGVSISLVTPNRAGEFAGKIFYLRRADKADAMLLSIVGSLSQVLITFCLGLFAFYYYLIHILSYSIDPNLLLSICAGISLISIVLFFNMKYIALNWKSWNFIHLLIPYHPEKFNLSKREIGLVVFLSLLRFGVFSFQYYLLLKVFDLPLGLFQTMVLIALYFFLISLIPTYALSELGVRGSVAISLFGHFGMSPASILASSLWLWIINLALPAILGYAFVYQLRFFATENE